jgi:hypothetical protein
MVNETAIGFDAIVEKCATVGELKELITNVIVSRKEKPNSYEVGKAGNRFTLVFDSPADLDLQIKSLKALGYMQDEDLTAK